jgi:hypothetical protein
VLLEAAPQMLKAAADACDAATAGATQIEMLLSTPRQAAATQHSPATDGAQSDAPGDAQVKTLRTRVPQSPFAPLLNA